MNKNPWPGQRAIPTNALKDNSSPFPWKWIVIIMILIIISLLIFQ